MRALPLVLCAALLACSPARRGDDDGEDPIARDGGSVDAGGFDAGGFDAGPITPGSPEELEAATEQAQCQALTCLFGLPPSLGDCGTAGASGELRKSIAAGRITMDATKTSQCVTALRNTAKPCWGANVGELEGSATTACAAALVGKVANEGTCYDDRECVSGGCDESGDHCPGACVAKRTANASCFTDSECASGLVCGAGDVCRAPGGTGASCEESDDCQASLRCDDGTCRALATVGNACTDGNDDCAAGLFCRKSATQGQAGTCQPRVDAGGACSQPGVTIFGFSIPSSPECKGHQMCIGVELDANDKVTKNGACGLPSDLNGSCKPRGATTKTMFHTTGCYVGLVCSRTSNTCVAPPPAGQACVDELCANTAYCNDGMCLAKKADGQPCETSTECMNDCGFEGFCEPESSSGGECVAP